MDGFKEKAIFFWIKDLVREGIRIKIELDYIFYKIRDFF